MENQKKKLPKGIEPWQMEDAQRLRDLFSAAQAAAKRAGDRLTQESFAETSGIASANMVWQYLSGHRALNIKAASAFAKGLGIQVQDFSPRLAAEIVAASATAAVQSPAPATTHEQASEGYSLPLEKLLLINAISEEEATVLRNYRMATERGRVLIVSAASAARKQTLSAIVDDEAKVRFLGASEGNGQ